MGMKISIKGILEGAWNSVFVKESIEEVAKERNEICKGCAMNSEHAKRFNNYKTFRPDFHCTVCGCDLHMKTRSLSSECPLGKWKALGSQEEEYQLTQKIENEQPNKNI